ncbi:hypothetical protein Glove_384g30 [Diversispora epigaea]|uniref:BTB domain-containing protein n=1 Tax=Diversispora epigaea TaxID=1348612 RepID=A0A397H7R9_9GLOM|nr:hypothetical protein Glove_384g30 [Diversispora epigaea]
MSRGLSLSIDLQLLFNNPKYSDVTIICAKSVKLHCYRAILAARSEVFDRLLFNGMKESFEQEIKFPEINAQAMKIILEFLYTGDFSNEDLSLKFLVDAYFAADFFQLLNLQDHIINKLEEILSNNSENSEEDILPELLTKAVRDEIPNSDPLADLLVKYITKIPLETIPYGSLSSPAFQFLLIYCAKEKISLANNQYTIFRYIALHAANEVEQEDSDDEFNVFMKTEACLPSLDKFLKKEHVITPKNINDLTSFRTKLSEKLTPMLDYVNIKLINGGILVEIIEPLEIVPTDLIIEAYRYKVKQEMTIREIDDFTWDINVCGPNLDISNDGYTVETPNGLISNERVRASQPIMNIGLYEWDIIIENPSLSDWVGICGEGEVTNFNSTDYYSEVWILGSAGQVSNNGLLIDYGSPPFWEGTKVRVHLNMGKRERKVAFSINGVKYPVVMHWDNIPAKVYPLVSLKYPGKFKIQILKKDSDGLI